MIAYLFFDPKSDSFMQESYEFSKKYFLVKRTVCQEIKVNILDAAN